MLLFDVITIFPEMFQPILSSSILKLAHEKNKIQSNIINLRDFTTDKHKVVDDIPYGGGSGMVMKPEPLSRAVRHLKKKSSIVINFSARGTTLSFPILKNLITNALEGKKNHFILVCGHYEGIDERFIEKYVDMEISLGDYILTGGEPAAIIFIDALSRLVPGVLGNETSLEEESFTKILLEYPHYTRPPEFEKIKIPPVLKKGHHKKIELWKLYQSLWITYTKRPDLFEQYIKTSKLNKTEKIFIEKIKNRNRKN